MRRTLLVVTLLASAGPAFAVQDRYGPPRAEPTAGVYATARLAGPRLDWNGKTPALQMAPQPPATQPEPIAPWAQRLAPAPTAAVATPAPQPPRALPPPPNAPQPYTARAAATPPPVPTAQAPGAAGRPRFYSVARQFGAEPDPIPVSAPQRGAAMTLAEIPATENLGRTTAPLDDGRANQAVAIPDTKQNAASNRISRLGF